MSHAGIITESTAVGADLKTLTGDVGAAVPGDGANNINFIGTAAQGLSFTGTPASHQMQGTIADATDIQKGVSTFDTDCFNVVAGDVTLNIGSTGGTDNAILRADGAGGLTFQASVLTIDDNGMVNIPSAAYPNTISGISFGTGNEHSIREYWDNKLYLKINGLDRFYISQTEIQGISTGGSLSCRADAPNTPGLTFGEDANSGFYYIDADKFGISAGGFQAAQVEEVSNIAWATFYNHLDFEGISAGYPGTQNIKRQAGVQTNNAVATQIAAITLANNVVVTIEARFNGFRNNYLAACGGYLQYTARRTIGGAIEVSTPNVNIDEDSAGAPTVDADVSGNDVRLLVTGVAAEDWNWTVTYNYNFLSTNV